MNPRNVAILGGKIDGINAKHSMENMSKALFTSTSMATRNILASILVLTINSSRRLSRTLSSGGNK